MMLILLLISIVIAYLGLLKVRFLLKQGATEIDVGILTPSDYCLMGRHMNFKDYNVKSIKAEIAAELKDRYDIDEIVYVNLVYDISKYYKVYAKYNEISKLKVLTDLHMKKYCEEHKCDKY